MRNQRAQVYALLREQIESLREDVRKAEGSAQRELFSHDEINRQTDLCRLRAQLHDRASRATALVGDSQRGRSTRCFNDQVDARACNLGELTRLVGAHRTIGPRIRRQSQRRRPQVRYKRPRGTVVAHDEANKLTDRARSAHEDALAGHSVGPLNGLQSNG